MRADQLLVDTGHATSRAQAQRLIASGVRWRVGSGAWQAVRKNAEDLPTGCALQVQDDAETRFASRGGLKLDGALTATDVRVEGRVCFDVGQSTGGFTDVLLSRGAAHVVGIDVGHGQLIERLRHDARVTVIEGVNARDAEAVASSLTEALTETLRAKIAIKNIAIFAPDGALQPCFDLLVGDVSFISLTHILPAVVPWLKPGGDLLMLVKPQFELQPEHIGKGGLVKSKSFYPQVETRLREACAALGLTVLQWLDSPITGGDGNREFFVHARQPLESAS